jgi:hypothetical protein
MIIIPQIEIKPVTLLITMGLTSFIFLTLLITGGNYEGGISTFTYPIESLFVGIFITLLIALPICLLINKFLTSRYKLLLKLALSLVFSLFLSTITFYLFGGEKHLIVSKLNFFISYTILFFCPITILTVFSKLLAK